MIRCTDPRIVQEVFELNGVGVTLAADLRGCLWIPDEFASQPAMPEHVIAGVAFNGFVGKTCAMHVIIQQKAKMSRAIIQEAFEYAFGKANLVTVFGFVDSTNKAALEFDRRLGFNEIYRVPGGAMVGDLVVLEMKREDCRWFKPAKE